MSGDGRQVDGTAADSGPAADSGVAAVAGPAAGRTWTLADSVALEARAYGWLILVVLPVLSLLPTVVGLVVVLVGGDVTVADATSTLWWVVLVPLVSAIPAFVATALSLPVTWAVGNRLRRVRSDRAHVAWTALTAAVLAVVSTAVAALLLAGGYGDPLVYVGSALPMGLAAGVAGALARRGQLRGARRRDTAEPTPEPPPTAPPEALV
ncbi:hypothetical protein QUG98_11085 [Curtobacterium sp. RHCJP20]|uniref:Uncharacterized protein n=1 Tax=Curtobacterium subtropicum TaxID=3055138 RepID=A0ABT7THD3_9MICO|nr:hypothetical protein [Curtobacterium subtropicum]MDM7888999.1 hypothetical protein [Curtobacterium subtropicum]